MAKWKNQFCSIENASALHERVREILYTDSMFKSSACWQEVPVKDLIPGYPFLHRYDWYLQKYNIILELHGIQHYKMQNFGNLSFDLAKKEFENIKIRDSLKKEAAIENGYTYIEISYKEYNKLSAQHFKQLIFG